MVVSIVIPQKHNKQGDIRGSNMSYCCYEACSFFAAPLGQQYSVSPVLASLAILRTLSINQFYGSSRNPVAPLPLPLLLPRRFFEPLYAALAGLMHEAFDRLGRQAVLEQELGRLFR